MIYSAEECPETLAFASEPVHASLANLISAAAVTNSQQGSASSPPQQTVQINGPDSHPVFLDVELKYGILQVRWFFCWIFGRLNGCVSESL